MALCHLQHVSFLTRQSVWDVLSVDGDVLAARQQEDRGHEELSTRCNFPPPTAVRGGDRRLGPRPGPVPGSFPMDTRSPAGKAV
jgi:hypothetical protein